MPTWLWLGGALLLAVVGIAVLVMTDPRQKENRMGTHSWAGEHDPYEASGGDVELLAAVTGIGEEQVPTQATQENASRLSIKGWDLRGGRDVDPAAQHPWRGEETL